jgi:hypothetical protein
MRAAITALTLFSQCTIDAILLSGVLHDRTRPTLSAVVAARPGEFIMVAMSLPTEAGRHTPCNT